MLIAVSGVVGSGKSTGAQVACDVAARLGREATVWRFQALPCFDWLKPRSARPPSGTASADAGRAATRGTGYRTRPLSAVNTLVYLARIVAFRWFMRTQDRGRVHVMNRYFYDLFAHFTLSSRRERAYLGALRAVLPRPDLALLFTADVATIAARRPTYSGAYVESVTAAYRRVHAQFPELVVIRSDVDDDRARLVAILEQQFSPSSAGR